MKTATDAYEKLVLFVDRLEKIRASLNSTANAFDSAFKTVKGQGGLLSKLERLNELDIHPKNKLDEKYLIEEKVEKV